MRKRKMSEERVTCIRESGTLVWELRTREGSETMAEVTLCAEHFSEGTTLTILEPSIAHPRRETTNRNQ